MYYIDIIADGENAVQPARVDFEEDAWIEFSAMGAEAAAMSHDSATEFSVRLCNEEGISLAESIYANGVRIG